MFQDDVWQAGVFNSKNGGAIKYTRKINFEYAKGDSREIVLSLPLSKFIEGRYNLQLYYNSIHIAKADLFLN